MLYSKAEFDCAYSILYMTVYNVHKVLQPYLDHFPATYRK